MALTPRYQASISQILFHPRKELLRFEGHVARQGGTPIAIWVGFVLIAVLGSCFYGASLSLVIAGFHVGPAALWLTLGAGMGWLVFGPTLVALSHRSPIVCAQACMVTMAYGEIILAFGALVNIVAYAAHAAGPWSVPFNFACVGLSNIVMGAALAMQLQGLGVPSWKTVLAWLVVLDGSGAFFFWILYRALLK